MSQSICTYGFIPVRSEPAEAACLETQILFGETFGVLEHRIGWCRIKCHYDNYEGWIDEKLVGRIDDREVLEWQSGKGIVINQPFVKIIRGVNLSIQYLSAGSRVVFNGEDLSSFIIGGDKYFWKESLPEKNVTAVDTASGLLNVPYLWGGRSFYGIDCSGLVQVAFKAAGIFLPRNASQQINYGKTVNTVEEIQAGDLAFFDNEEGKIVHVGLCLGKGRILHASGAVRIDALDHQGIYNLNRRIYTHHLYRIKRVDL